MSSPFDIRNHALRILVGGPLSRVAVLTRWGELAPVLTVWVIVTVAILLGVEVAVIRHRDCKRVYRD
jgi:hypothetical protein